jgi:hypothetical protein
MNWIKREIEQLIPEFKHLEPYKYWHLDLFKKINLSAFKDAGDEKIILFNLYVGTKQRLTETVRLWSSVTEKSAVEVSSIIADMYLIYVFPRETLLPNILGCLQKNTHEWRICENYCGPESDYRHIRNSLSHGSFKHAGHKIIFQDRKWKKTISTSRIRLDFLVLADIILSLNQN